MLVLNQLKDDCRKYFMIDLHERIVKDPVGIKPMKIFHDQSPHKNGEGPSGDQTRENIS